MATRDQLEGQSNSGSRARADISLLSLSFLRGAAAQRVEELARHVSHRTLSADELLWRAGDQAQHFTAIARGLVRVERTMPSGEPTIVAIFGPHESIGETAALQAVPYPGSAIATSPTVEVLQLPAQLLRAAMERDASVADAVHRTVLSHTEALRAKIDIMSAGSVPARLSALLLHLAARFGDQDEAGVTHIPVLLSRRAVAHLVSARVETVIRALSSWQRAGLVRTSLGGFEVADCGRLSELLAKG